MVKAPLLKYFLVDDIVVSQAYMSDRKPKSLWKHQACVYTTNWFHDSCVCPLEVAFLWPQ